MCEKCSCVFYRQNEGRDSLHECHECVYRVQVYKIGKVRKRQPPCVSRLHVFVNYRQSEGKDSLPVGMYRVYKCIILAECICTYRVLVYIRS